MAGISSKAAGSLANKYQYNGGNELQSAEFSDGSGLEMYDAKNRMYDPQTGRFGQVDEFSEVTLGWSTYSFAFDNPIRFNDPLGLRAGDSAHPVALPDVTVKGSYTQAYKQATYMYFRDNNIDFSRARNKSLRNWMENYDGTERVMERVHQMTREGDMIALETASFFVPLGEIPIIAKLGEGALALFKLKRGLQVAEIGVQATEGIYQFTAASGKVYVGQSGNILERLAQHIVSGKLLEGTQVQVTEVLGGKLAREIAEQLRINELGGIYQNGMKVLENIRNPIGAARQYLLH